MKSIFKKMAITACIINATYCYADNQAFMYKVCELLPQPFSGSITTGGGDGCTWGLSDASGVTIESEKIEALASLHLNDEQLKQFSDMWKAMLDGGAVPEFGIKPEPLTVCDGGWKLGGKIANHPPSMMGFYKCGHSFVTVTTQGEKSVAKFNELTNKMVPLVK